MAKLRWGVLSTARINRMIIPAVRASARSELTTVASRDIDRCRAYAREWHIPRTLGSYDALLADPEIDVIYIGLPNSLHVEWTVRALEAGKHVLCEKPIAMTAAEAAELIAVRDRTGVKIGEAFMVRTHPQWLRAREIVGSGAIGELRSTLSAFSYFNVDPKNVRNIREIGGGGIMDIGCYPITMSRWLFGREPRRVISLLDRDPQMGTDRLSSAILDFAPGQAVFTCATQLVPFQTMQILGTCGRIEMEIPYNIPPDRPSRIFIDDGSELAGRGAQIEEFATCDAYTAQGDAFARAIQEGAEVPVPLEDAKANMAVIDTVFRSAETRQWEQV